MIQNDPMSKADFEYLTVNQARMIMIRKIKCKKEVEKLMTCVEDKVLTGYQLKDILVRYTDITEV